MAEYNHLYKMVDWVDDWYDSLNDVHTHSTDDEGQSYPRFNQLFYTYLSCIEEFSNNYEV